MAAHVLALFVIVSQPVATLAWLGGMHATPDQAALHEAAIAHGLNHHHGTSEHHEHQLEHSGDNSDVHFSRSLLGPEFAAAVPYVGPYQDLLQNLFEATLAVLADTRSPGEEPRHGSPAKELPSQRVPSVPHRPPILLPSILTFV